MKAKYQELELGILLFQEEDIVRTSPNDLDDAVNDPFKPGEGEDFG